MRDPAGGLDRGGPRRLALARWYGESLEVIHSLGGGGSSEGAQSEHELITAVFSDPSVWLLRELLHACCGRRPV
ncbi:MAG: hypothetical protein JO039_11595 [Solirubrobacterales bacterium]|nr:hypothetical protein [Solirubrobacterales bacterium]